MLYFNGFIVQLKKSKRLTPLTNPLIYKGINTIVL